MPYYIINNVNVIERVKNIIIFSVSERSGDLIGAFIFLKSLKM